MTVSMLMATIGLLPFISNNKFSIVFCRQLLMLTWCLLLKVGILMHKVNKAQYMQFQQPEKRHYSVYLIY